jgi:hypothetical protein
LGIEIHTTYNARDNTTIKNKTTTVEEAVEKARKLTGESRG